ISGAGTVRLASGTWWLGNGGSGTTIAMSSGGLVDLQAGKITNDYANANWSGNLGSLNVASGALFDMRNNNVVVYALNGGGAIYDAGYSNSLTMGAAGGGGNFTGTIGVGGTTVTLIKNGAGTQILSGVNTYTGSTTIGAGGVLQIAAAGSLGSGSYNGA